MNKKIASFIIVVFLALPLSSVQAYNYAGYRWGGSYPTVGIDTSRLYLTAWRSAATDAMNNWNSTGSRWTIVNYAPSGNTMSTYYDPNTTTLAYTRNYRTGVLFGNVYRSTISVNNAQSFNPPYGGCSYDLRSVLRHEIGHFLVLNHEDRFWTLMNSTIGCGDIRNITSDEYSAIRNIYGVR